MLSLLLFYCFVFLFWFFWGAVPCRDSHPIKQTNYLLQKVKNITSLGHNLLHGESFPHQGNLLLFQFLVIIWSCEHVSCTSPVLHALNNHPVMDLFALVLTLQVFFSTFFIKALYFVYCCPRWCTFLSIFVMHVVAITTTFSLST